MSHVKIVHTIEIPNQGPSIFATNEKVPGVIFCFNDIKETSIVGKFNTDVSVIADPTSQLASNIADDAENYIDETFEAVISIVTEVLKDETEK